MVRSGLGAARLVRLRREADIWCALDRSRGVGDRRGFADPRGPNFFDDAGKKALFGRCFMFMDAQRPNVLRVERKTGSVFA